MRQEVGRPLGRCCNSLSLAGGGAWIREIVVGMEKVQDSVCILRGANRPADGLGHTNGAMSLNLRVWT